jgi:deoxyribonucleoside regulator
VRISVAEYEPRHQALERDLCKRFKLVAAAVIRTVPGLTAEEVRRTVGHFGAPFVASLISAGNVVAIAGGRTISELIRPLPMDKERRLTVVQAMGSIDAQVGPVDALMVGRTMAQRSGGFFLTLNTPAFVADKRMRDSLLAHEQIRGLWQRLKQANVALVGIGTLENSVFVDRGVFSDAARQELRACGAVGEICGRFYDQSGSECDSRWRDRVMSIDLERVRRIPQVIAAVAGADRAAAIAAAIRGGLVKSLVIDEAGAQALLQQEAPSAKAGTRSGK